MYIDGVILFSLLMIALILVMMAYIGVYFFKHIKQDAKAADNKTKNRAGGHSSGVKQAVL